MTQPADRAAAAPYIGLRPYTEAERDRFFGRERDALLLRNKILAAPLTVLYAMSGVGKSSLLRALVEPLLREQGAHVVYYDSWAERDPAQGVALELRRSIPADRRSVPPGASLAVVAQAAATALDKPIVLVLDQFEKLLLQRGEGLDPLGVELATLIHADANVRVVLSLREEFVASLDSLRGRIMNLFSSTYRLRPLDEVGVREAIMRPAEQCGGSVEPGLVDALVKDLRGDSPEQLPTATGLLPGNVELPFLQLVCSQLWAAAEGDGHRLTLARYEKLERRDGIIRAYVRGLIRPLSRRQRTELARLLDLLAPRSGAKMSFAAEDLSHNAKVSSERAAQLLDHLAKTYVVRVRSTPGTTWYELYHDAFIRVLRSWVDDELKWVERRRWLRNGAFASLALPTVLVLLVFWGRHKEKAAHTQPVEDLASVAWRPGQTAVDVDAAANWYLARAREGDFDGEIEELLRLLAPVKGVIQWHYAREAQPEARTGGAGQGTRGFGGGGSDSSNTKADTIALCAPEISDGGDLGLLQKIAAGSKGAGRPRSTRCSFNPVDLRIGRGEGVTLDLHRLEDAWRGAASLLADSIGIPPPSRIIVETKASWHPRRIQATLGAWSIDLTGLAESTFVAEDSLDARVRDYLRADTTGRWAPVAAMARGGRWWRVPRWTLPLWHASGHPNLPTEEVVVLAVLMQLTAKPEMLLTRETVTRMLESVSVRPRGRRGSPDSVRVALETIVRSRHSIRNVAGLMAAMARDTGAVRDSATALRVWRAATEAACRLAEPGRVAEASGPLATSDEFAEVLRALPESVVASDARHRRLYVCLLQGLVGDRRYASADSAFATWPDSGWTPQEDYLLGYWMVHRAAAHRSGEATPGTTAHLAAALKRWRGATADSAYFELRSLCNNVWDARQCWSAYDTLARVRPDRFWPAMLAGYYLSLTTFREHAQAAIENLGRAQTLVPLLPSASRPGMRDWIALARGMAHETLAEYGDSTGLGAAIRGLEGIPERVNSGPAISDVRGQLMTTYLFTDRLSDAEEVLRRWPYASPDPAVNRRREAWSLFLFLARDPATAVRGAAAAPLPDTTTPEGLYTATLAALLGGRPDQDSLAERYYLTNHEYRDYIRMLQFWSLSMRNDPAYARRVIDARWAQIDTSTWRERAQSGDRGVWRETLIGMYARAIARETVLGMLDNSARPSGAPYTLLGHPPRGLRCEVYFYDALLQDVTGEAGTRHARAVASFDRAIASDYRLYYEYHMARLIRRRYVQSERTAN